MGQSRELEAWFLGGGGGGHRLGGSPKEELQSVGNRSQLLETPECWLQSFLSQFLLLSIPVFSQAVPKEPMEEAHYPKLFVPVLVTLTDLKIPRLGSRGGWWEIWWSQAKHPHFRWGWVHLLPSPLGCVILTFISLTLPNFPSSLGLGKALAPHLQFRRWGHTQPGSGKLGPVFHPEELLKLLKQGMVWSYSDIKSGGRILQRSGWWLDD